MIQDVKCISLKVIHHKYSGIFWTRIGIWPVIVFQIVGKSIVYEFFLWF